ncbi:hypothetical protein C8D87_1242 [Lentzea atacamensis]|uniref:Uncharacterized protein n=2 Tax=Lentzea TaxID=165301 RepID=A0ABX9DWE7_9PSEU|nr:hypothetical protein [Lentzea atacamensis]RAS57104.1 hypothetical protein C8D87_1242 [Lentzea atacamensis]
MNTTASATVNDVATKFIPATRPAYVTTPVVASINVTIPLDRDDLVALMFFCHTDPGFATDSADDDYLRLLIVDTVVNGGLTFVDETRGEIEEMSTNDPRRVALEFCRHLVARLFPDVPAQTRRPNTRRAITAAPATLVRELVNA